MKNELFGLVSVIVPVFNVEKYIEKCIRSIISQTYIDLEVIIVNDGSLDDSESIIFQLMEEDNRIKYVKRKNGGLGAARNTGLNYCNGEFVCFIDSDDWIRDDYIEKLVNSALNDNSDIVICNMKYIYENGTFKNRTPYIAQHECINRREALRQEFIGKKYRFHAPNKFCRTKLFKDNGILFPEGKLYEDVFTTYRLILYSDKVTLLNEDLYFYLQNRSGSIMNSNVNLQRFTDMYEALDNIIADSDVIRFNIKSEIQSLYLTNIISLLNYICPLVGDLPYKEVKRYFEYIRKDKNYYLLKSYMKNKYLSKMEKIRIAMFCNCFYVYCYLMKGIDRLRGRQYDTKNS